MSNEKKLLKEKFEYYFKDKLGSGSFAEVYKGRTLDTNEELAIKIISKQGIKKYGEDILKAIGNEVTILQKISYSITSPFIIKIFDCFQTENNIYMILEFCNQGTLDDILKKKKKLEEREAKIIIYQVLCALDLLAEHDIAHRDIKPENVFISNGIYKLGDFGFASQKQLFGTTLGTYPYMAPEMFKNGNYTKSVDVWALGVMYHQMLFGELYFIGKNHLQVSENILKREYIVPKEPQISKESKEVLTKCLIKDENKRITTKQLKNHPLFADIIDDVNKQVNQMYQTINNAINNNANSNSTSQINQNNKNNQQQQQQQFSQVNQNQQFQQQQQFNQQQQQQPNYYQTPNPMQQVQNQSLPQQRDQQQVGQQQLQNQQQFQLSPENQKVLLNLTNHVQGCQFLVDLAEKLSVNLSMTRFQIHYILKKALKKYKKVVETLNGLENQQQQPSQKQTQELLSSPQYKQFKQNLNQQYDLCSFKFEEFTQDLNSFIERSFMQNSFILKSVISSDLNSEFPEELYTQELDFLTKQYFETGCKNMSQQQQYNNQQSQNEFLIVALMLVIAKNYDTYAGKNFQFQQFQQKKQMMNPNELKMVIENQQAFQQFFGFG